MQVTDDEMLWILTLFLKDSLEFLSDPKALGVRRGDWIKIWRDKYANSEERIKEWTKNEPYDTVE